MMSSELKTFGISVANRIVIPVACLSGLATIGLLWCMLPHKGTPTFDIFQAFLVSFSILCLAIGFLIWRRRRAKALVASINMKEGLSLDDTQFLGYPRPLFVVFDHARHKLAQCQSATGDYQVRDFSWVTGWRCEWVQVERRFAGGVEARIVNASGMSVPAFEIRREFIDYALVLEVADASHPVLRFPMNRTEAEKWCARCKVFFNY